MLLSANLRHRLLALLGLLAVLASAGAGAAWWYRTSRPEARLRRAQEALRRGNDTEARSLLAQLEDAGRADEAHLLRGEMHYRRGAFAAALAALNEIRDEGPLRGQAAVLGGHCFLALGNLHEAARHFHYGLEEDPDNLSARRGMARVYEHQGAVAQAIEHLEAVVRLDPDDGWAWQLLGNLFKDLETDPPRAIHAYQEALRCGVVDADEVRQELAELLVKTGAYADALQLLENTEGTRPALAAYRGEALAGLQRGAEAVELLDRALLEHPRSIELLRARAKMEMTAGAFQTAAPLLERLLEQDRYDYPSRYQLAQAYEGLGRKAAAADQRRLAEEAKRGLEEISKLNQEATARPWDAELRRRLAELCARLDKPELAAMWRQAAETCPRQGKDEGRRTKE